MANAVVEVTLLGEVAVRINGQQIRLPSQKAYCLLAYTVLGQQQKASIPDLLDLLWPSSPMSRGRHSVSQLLYAIKVRCAPAELLHWEGDQIRADLRGASCDVVHFNELVRSGDWRAAIDAYGGGFLQGLDISADTRYEHWRDGVDARLVGQYERCVDGLMSGAAVEDPAETELWTRQSLFVFPNHAGLLRLHYQAIADQGRFSEAEHGISVLLSHNSCELRNVDRDTLLTVAASIASTRERRGKSSRTKEVRPAFVGRTAELVQLRGIWAQAVEGFTTAVLLPGEPGVGKTRLLEQFARFAAIRGGRVLMAAASPATTQVPFAGIRDLLSEIQVDVQAVSTLRSGQLMDLVMGRANLAHDADRSESALYAECEEFIRILTAQRPLFIGIDDLQWLDESSLRLLIYLAYRCQGDRLLVALGTRPEGEHNAERLRAVVETHVVNVDRMPEAAAESLLSTYCVARGWELTRDIRETLLERAEGNPFFLTALAADVIREREADVRHAQSAIPESVSTLITSRLRQVSEAARDTLRTLAILRTEEPIGVIAKIGRRSPLRIARAVEELVRMGLAVDGTAGVRAAHDIIADVVYGSIQSTVRRYLHERMVDVLPDRGAAFVAAHASKARNWAAAFSAARQAGTAAASIGAYSEADFFLTMAQSVAESDEEQCEAAAAYLSFVCGLDRFSSGVELLAAARRHFCSRSDRHGLLRCAAVELSHAIERGTRPLDELTAEATELVRQAEAIGSTRLAAETLSVLYRAVELGSVEGSAADWVVGAVKVAERADVDWKVTLLGKAAILSYFALSPEAAWHLASRLQSLAGEDARLRALAFGYVGVVLMLMGRLLEAQHSYREALKLARDPALADAFHKASMNLAVLEIDIGHFESARKILSQAASTTPKTMVWVANSGLLCLEAEDLEGAETAAEELRRRSGRSNAPMALAAAATLDGLIAWTREDFNRADANADVVALHSDEIPFQSDDSYGRILVARSRGRLNAKVALKILDRQSRRASVPQLRIDLERALQLSRLDRAAGGIALKRLVERAECIGAGPIAVRGSAALAALALT